MYYLTVKNLLYVRRSRHKAHCWATMAAVLALHTFWGSAQNAEFEKTCAVCHGGGGEGTDRAPALANNRELRGVSEKEIAALIRNGRGNMPAFSLLPAEQVEELAHFVHSLNADAFEAKPAGDVAAGADFFYGSGRCVSCHTAQGRGGTNGPDLSSIGRQVTLSELEQSLRQPDARIAAGYAVVEVTLRNGSTLRGFARSQGAHDLQLQTLDGQLHLLLDNEYTRVVAEKHSLMPAFNGTPQQYRDLVAFLSTLGGVGIGANPAARERMTPSAIDQVLHPKPGDWPTYSGNVNGNRYSSLSNIDQKNVGSLRPAWIHPLPYFGLETTPLVIDGVMYVTGPNQVEALDARTGREIWNYSRPRAAAGSIPGDAEKGANRGAAVLDDRVFFITDNAHLICLQRLTGALLWEVILGEPRYGGTSPPLIAGDLVIAGVSGGDEGIRGLIAAYNASTGEEVWRFWTVPRAGEPGSETWKDDPHPQGGTTWTAGSYDGASGVLYWGTGNPYPDTDGDHRSGNNLYTASDVALDARTGKLLWYFQFTPHDIHDWDANQPLVLVDASFHGRERKLLLHANRNGFFYVLDRTNGEFLQATPIVKKLSWASGIGADGRPQLLPNNDTTLGGVQTCPAVRGATNWYSTAYNPSTSLYYVMTVEDCSIYRKAHDGGYGPVEDLTNPAMKVLRAFALETGKIAWELPLTGPPERNYSGVLSTAGGLVFFGETSGGFAAVDAKTGKFLWHFEASEPWKASPITYMVDGRQYVAIASGSNILSFALPDK
jgi:PQQ-dependent dehydrogenase (methanol/ethanol family)